MFERISPARCFADRVSSKLHHKCCLVYVSLTACGDASKVSDVVDVSQPEDPFTHLFITRHLSTHRGGVIDVIKHLNSRSMVCRGGEGMHVGYVAMFTAQSQHWC